MVGPGRGRAYAVIGGTGILRPLASALARAGSSVVVISRGRRPSLVEPGVSEVHLDARDAGALARVVAGLPPLHGVVAYRPAVSPASWAVLREVGTRVLVLTSAHAAPGATVEDWEDGSTRLVQLGWTGDPARWHTPAEISPVCLSALDAAAGSRLAVGRTRPWDERPG